MRLQKMAQELTGVEGNIVMYVMTSEHTKQPTEKFFKEHNYFGMKEKNVVFFEQRMIPCFDFKSRIILETPTSVARAPDGNGGLYWALKHELEGTVEILLINGANVNLINDDDDGYLRWRG